MVLVLIRAWFGEVECTAGTVEETVASLDGVVDLVGTSVVVDLPQAEAHKGHLIAAAKLDSRGNHCEEI
jgi:hypothetical protein